MQQDDLPEDEEAQHSPQEIRPAISYRTAMIGYAVLAALCFATLHGDPLYLTLLIIGALAIKTWLAKVKSKLE
jgi:hypothetical protein